MGGVWGLRVNNQLHLVRLLCNWEVKDIVIGLCCDIVILKRGKYALHSLSPFKATVLPLTVYVTKAKSFLDTITYVMGL